MERKALFCVLFGPRCKAPHFVYQWTFQPIPPQPPPHPYSNHHLPLPPPFPPLSVIPLTSSSLVCCWLSTPFICFNLVAHYSKEKAFCIEKKKTIIFFIPLSNNKYLFTAADSEKTHFWEPASTPWEAALVCVCSCMYGCVCVCACVGVCVIVYGCLEEESVCVRV